jgi:hypothetical protein
MNSIGSKVVIPDWCQKNKALNANYRFFLRADYVTI